MKSPIRDKVYDYLSPKVELLATLTKTPQYTNEQHAAVTKITNHLRAAYSVFGSDFGDVTLERVQGYVQRFSHCKVSDPDHRVGSIVRTAIDQVLSANWASPKLIVEEMIEAVRKEAMSNHARKFITRGLPPPQIIRSIKHHRTPNCYACHDHLDNRVNVECEACGWIICLCGACGCNFAPAGST